MTMTLSHVVKEDEEDSVYSGSPLPPPISVSLVDKILDENNDSVKELDRLLDEEDEQYELKKEKDDTSVEESEEESLDDEGRGNGGVVELLDSPPRKPTVEGLPDDITIGVSAEGMNTPMGTTKVVGRGYVSSSEEEVAMSVKVVEMEDDDDWFDSDENKVEVESLESSSDEEGVGEVRQGVGRFGVGEADNGKIEDSQSEKRGGGGTGGVSLFMRASQTFYKAFRKGTTKKIEKKEGGGKGAIGSRVGGNEKSVGGNVVEMEVRHGRLEQLLESQIATLNGAQTGFVDLNIMQPMTKNTVDTIMRDGTELLNNFGVLERRVREVKKEEEVGAAGELEMKERMLIEAKVRLAEAAAEVEGLRHDLRKLQKELESSGNVKIRKWEVGREKRERAVNEVTVAKGARMAAEGRLERERKELERERGKLERVEKGFRDIQGDWA